MTNLTRLDEQFTDEVRQFEGRGGKTFDYIEDETVMDRLDEVLGKGGWYVTVEPISVADGIVKVAIHWPVGHEGLVRVYEDFGYASNANGEALKEAVSDGIRRCGRYLGVGRYLYRKHDSPSGTGRAVPSSSARPAAAPRPTIVEDPYADLPPPWEAQDFKPSANPHEDVCPDHGSTWTLRPGGVSKAGKPYDAFWTCGAKNDDGSFCRNKPSKAWQARHEG